MCLEFAIEMLESLAFIGQEIDVSATAIHFRSCKLCVLAFYQALKSHISHVRAQSSSALRSVVTIDEIDFLNVLLAYHFIIFLFISFFTFF